MSENTVELRDGDVIDERYRVVRRIGRGGMGTVYEVQQIKLQRSIALKVLRPEFAEKESAAKRFEREARAASSVDHRNVVKILDFGHLPTGELYYTMEMLQGQDLFQLLKKSGALPWSRAGWIILQVVRAFAAIHDQGIVHRDIKPANCFILAPKPGEEPDTVKILDFGIANLQDQSESAALTGAADILGSVSYMAPEQVSSGSVDARTDIYSLGVMMYELLTGEKPFNDPAIFQIMLAHKNKAPQPPRELKPEILPEVEAIILCAMAKAPEDRFQSMRELEAVLLPLVEMHGTMERVGTVPRVAPVPVPPPAAKPNPPVLVSSRRGVAMPVLVGVALFAAGVGGVAWWMSTKSPKPQTAQTTPEAEAAPQERPDDEAPPEPEPEPAQAIALGPPPEKQYDPFADPFGAPPLQGRTVPRASVGGDAGTDAAGPDGAAQDVPLEELLPPEPWTLEPGSVSGRILDGEQKAVADTRVCAWLIDPRAPSDLRRQPRCAQADRRGRFSIADVVPGFYDVHAFARGYVPASVLAAQGYPIVVSPRQARSDVELVIEPGGVEVHGTVKSRSGEPVAGAKVAVLGPARALTVADDSGQFSLWASEGDLSVLAWAEGYADVVAQGQAADDFSLVLRQHSILLGRVVDAATGEPVVGARVRAGNQKPGVDPLVYTGSDGEFRIPGLTESVYQPSARTDDGYGQAAKPTEIKEATISPEIIVKLAIEAPAEPPAEPVIEEAGSDSGGEIVEEPAEDDGGEAPSTAPTKAAPTNASLRSGLSRKLERCGEAGSIEVRAKYVLESGKLFQADVRVTGAGDAKAAIEQCARKHVGSFRLLRRKEPTEFKPLVVKL